MSYARELGFAIRQASSDQGKEKMLQKELGISELELQKLYAGRLFLKTSDIKKVAEVCGVSVGDLLNADPKRYNEEAVHCMTEFTDPENREMILNLIDAYIDARESLDRTKKS